jgi:2-polyprenyl-3-methyl-5-hydroxy-6-metoxy-1,4-benzoquinol methylase
MEEPGQSSAPKYSDDPTQSVGFRVVENKTYGYRHLDPIPHDSEVTDFYQSRYYDLVRKGNRAPELRRLLEGGEAASRELQWLRQGLHTDIVSMLERLAPGRKLMEVGCGTGDFLAFAREHRFTVSGTEPATEAAQRAASNQLSVHNMTLENFVAQYPAERFDVVVMINVLEHVPDPIRTLRECRQLLHPSGILCMRVPNDFSEIQAAAHEKLGADPWWIAVPDHINYFNFESLRQVLGHLGFETVYAQGDFPMEIFLLMGENYVRNPQVGSNCHARRVQFDLGIPAELRRKIYAALGSVGVGRDCLVFGKKLGA